MVPAPFVVGGVYMPRYSSLFHRREHSPAPTILANCEISGFLLWSSNGLGLVGNGWVGDSCSPLTEPSPCGTLCSLIGHTSSPVLRLTTNRKPCLVDCISAGIFLPSTVIFISVGAALMS